MVSPESVLQGVVWDQPLTQGSYVPRTGQIRGNYADERAEQLDVMASQMSQEIGLRYPIDFDVVSANIYRSPETAADALKQLGIDKYGEITSADTALFQAGMHALVGLTVLRTTHKPAQYVVTTVSRGNERTPIGIANQREMDDLTLISDELESGLKQEYRGKVSAVKPIVKGIATMDEAEYPYFIAPFCPLGELHVYINVIGNSGVPILKYAVPYNKQMRDTNERQDEHLSKFLLHLGRGNRVLLEREIRYLGDNLRSLFTAQMAIYFASGQRFPKNFWLSAGDFMGKIHQTGSIDTALITCRGGLGERTPISEFIKTRVESIEGDSLSSTHPNMSIQGQIFAGFDDPVTQISAINETIGMFQDDYADKYRRQVYMSNRRTQ